MKPKQSPASLVRQLPLLPLQMALEAELDGPRGRALRLLTYEASSTAVFVVVKVKRPTLTPTACLPPEAHT